MSQEWQDYIERLEEVGLNKTLVGWIDNIYRPDLGRFARMQPEKLYADLNARSESGRQITLEQAKRILEVAREDSPSEGVTTIMSPTVPNQPSVTAESARTSLPAAQRQPVPLEKIARQAGLPDGETKATTAKSPQENQPQNGRIRLERSQLVETIRGAQPALDAAGVRNTSDLRRLGRQPDELRRLNLGEEGMKAIAEFADLTRIFPADVAVALQEAGLRSIDALQRAERDRFAATLHRAGFKGNIMARETARLERLQAMLEDSEGPDYISGITVDLGLDPNLSTGDLEQLREAQVDTLTDWIGHRESLKLTKEGNSTLGAHARLKAVGIPATQTAELFQAGIKSALDLAQLNVGRRKVIADQYRIPEEQIVQWQKLAAGIVRRVSMGISQTAVNASASFPQWMQPALEVGAGACEDEDTAASALSKYAYFIYLLNKTKQPVQELDDIMHQEFGAITATSSLDSIHQIDICIEVLSRAYPGPLTHDERMRIVRHTLVSNWAVIPISPAEIFQVLVARLDLTLADLADLARRFQAALMADILSQEPTFSEEELTAMSILTEEYMLARQLEFVSLTLQEVIDAALDIEPGLDGDSLKDRLLELIAGHPRSDDPTFSGFERQTLQTVILDARLNDEGRRQVVDVLREAIQKTRLVRREVYKNRANLSDRELFERLFIETNLGDCEMITRLDQAIRSLQAYLDHLVETATTLAAREGFQYLIYDVWRAEQMAIFYPELKALWKDDVLAGEGDHWDRGSIVANRDANRQFIKDQLDLVEEVIAVARVSKGRSFSDFKQDESLIDDDKDAEDFKATPYYVRFNEGLDLIRAVLSADDEIKEGVKQLDQDLPGLALKHFKDSQQMLAGIAGQVFEPNSHWTDPSHEPDRSYQGLLEKQPQQRGESLVMLGNQLFYDDPKTIYTALGAETTESLLGGTSSYFDFDDGEWSPHAFFKKLEFNNLDRKHDAMVGPTTMVPDPDRIVYTGAGSEYLQNYEFTTKFMVKPSYRFPSDGTCVSDMLCNEQIGIGVRISGDAGYKLVIETEVTNLKWQTWLVLYKLDSNGDEVWKQRSDEDLPLFEFGETYDLSLEVTTDDDNPNRATITGRIFGESLNHQATRDDESAYTQGTFALYCSRTLEAKFRPVVPRIGTPADQQATPPFYAQRRGGEEFSVHSLPVGQALFVNHVENGVGMAAELLEGPLVEISLGVVTMPLKGLKARYMGAESDRYLLFKKGELAVTWQALEKLDLLLERCLALTFYMRYAVLPVRLAQAYLRSGAYEQAVDMLHLLYDESASAIPGPNLYQDPNAIYPLSAAQLGYASAVSADSRLMRLRLAEVYLAWADWEFRHNTEDSRYRARQLYDLVLALHDDPGYCTCDEPISYVISNLLLGQARTAAANLQVEQSISIVNKLHSGRSYLHDWEPIINRSLAIDGQPDTTSSQDITVLEQAIEEAEEAYRTRLEENTALTELQRLSRTMVEEGELQEAASSPTPIISMAMRTGTSSIGGSNPWRPGYGNIFDDLDNLFEDEEDEEDGGFEVDILVPPTALPIPSNPLRTQQKRQACFMLDLLRSCRNILGYTDATVPPLRFEALLRLAQYFADQALAAERDLLSFRQNFEQEIFSFSQAKNSLVLSNVDVALEKLGVEEAAMGIRLAALQHQQLGQSVQHYEALIREGWTAAEQLAFGSSVTAAGASALANVPALAGAALGVAGLAGMFTTPVNPAGGAIGAATSAIGFLGAIAGGASGVSTTAGQVSSSASMYASFERRDQEWRYQLGQSRIDASIARQSGRQAGKRFEIALVKQNAANLKQNFATDSVNFLNHKQLNTGMWLWMMRTAREAYRTRLNYAIAAAYMAERALAFELQNRAMRIVQFDYFDISRDGMLGATQLQTDLSALRNTKLDQTKRKLQLTKTFSLAHLLPGEFVRFKQTGRLPFRTILAQFDRDYPGHYLRLIKNVRVTVVALVPPTQGIRATLRNSGVSKAVVEPMFEEVVVRRDPQAVALSSPYAASGLFVLDYKDDFLLPFEGIGVETDWLFEMPRATNPINYQTIADIMIEVEYTALSNDGYRTQVLRSLDHSLSVDQAFSVRHHYPDAWYHLHNPLPESDQTYAAIDVYRKDFMPNLEDITIDQASLLLVSDDSAVIEQPVQLWFTEGGQMWTDYLFAVDIISDDDDGIGVMFRFQDAQNYYRFSWNRQETTRRLEKLVNGVFTILFEDDVPYVQGQTYQLSVRVQGSQIEVRIDDTLICAVSDPALAFGSIALYTWRNAGSHFENVSVVDGLGTVLLSEQFQDNNLNGWEVVDEGLIESPSSWSVNAGRLTQNSNIYTEADNNPGTYAVWSGWGTGGSATPVDGVASTRLGTTESWQALLGKTPFGSWLIALPNTGEVQELIKHGRIDDIVLILTCSGQTTGW